MQDAYETQDRGGAAEYERYLTGMDASMRQKVALTAAHLLCEGQLADMGMGSGSGSHALASLYPDLCVTGVDVNAEMVRLAGERYQLTNLRFVQGDIAEPCFAADSQEAILNSSVLHHVTSFNGYDRAAAARALAVQTRQIADDGVLIVLEVVCSRFDELDQMGNVVGRRVLEYVVPRPLSRNTVAVAPLCLHNGEVLFGVDDDDRPAAQCFCGSSQLLVAPAWRLPRDVVGIRDSRSWIGGRMRQEYGAVVTEAWELGGAYFPSPGVTPEVVYPLALQVDCVEPNAPLQLNWVPLTQLVRNRGRLHDGHLLTLVLRAAHALVGRA